MGWGATRVVMCTARRAHGPHRLRRLAERPGLATRRVPRHRQAMERREHSPEAAWGAPAAGRAWLLRRMVAPRWGGGLTRGVGAAPLRAGCRRRRVEAPVGCAPRARRRVRPPLAGRLLAPAAAWAQAGMAHGESRPRRGAVEAPFVPRRLRVCRDRARG